VYEWYCDSVTGKTKRSIFKMVAFKKWIVIIDRQKKQIQKSSIGTIHLRRPARWRGRGGVNQNRTITDGGGVRGGGLALKQDVHLWRFWANFLHFGLWRHPRPRLSGSQNMLRFCEIRAGRPRMGGGCLPNGWCQTGGRGGGQKKQFLLGRLWWMTPNQDVLEWSLNYWLIDC